MNNIIAVVVVAVAVLLGTSTATVNADPEGCVGTLNPFPINEAAPKFLRAVPNGKLYQGGMGNDTFYITHLYGNPYQKGYAQGQLLGKYFHNFTDMLDAFIEETVEEKVSWLPKWLVDLIAQYGAPIALEMTYNWVAPFIPDHFDQEMSGIADAAGIPIQQIRHVNLFPELIKAACTIVGATGPATPNGKIAHLRGLDMDPNMPLKDFAAITVYHPEEGKEGTPAFANFGWGGMIGSLTGISETIVSIGEKYWGRDTLKYDGVKGKPWMFMVRDALLEPNLDAVIKNIAATKRTAAVFLGIGDSTTNSFNIVAAAQKAFHVINDTVAYNGHPALPGVTYVNKHEQPSGAPCLGNLLKENYGQLKAEFMAINISSIGMTGDLHSVAFDYANKVAFYSNARKSYDTTGSLPAYNRQYTRVDLAALFAEKQ